MIDVGELYGLHHERLVAYLLRRCGDRELAEDLAQNVWLKVQRYAESYEDRGMPVSAWLFTIARNLLTDHRRSERTAVSLEVVPEPSDVTMDAGGEWQVRRLELEGLIARLTPLQRAVIEARFLRSLSIRRTAAQAGCSEEAVKKRQARGLAQLKRMLEEAA